MHAFWGDRALAVDGSAVTGTRCALPHWNWTAGTPRPALGPVVAARFALPRSTRPTLHRAHTAACADARPTPEAARLPAPCASGPRARDSRKACDARAGRRTPAVSSGVARPVAAHTPRR